MSCCGYCLKKITKVKNKDYYILIFYLSKQSKFSILLIYVIKTYNYI